VPAPRPSPPDAVPRSRPSPPGTALRLRPPGPDDEAAVRAAHRAMEADDFGFAHFLTEDEPWAAWLDDLAVRERGVDLPPDRVRSTFLVADVGGVIVGRSSIRFALNDELARWHGHIGYGVLAPYRRRGHATEILRQSLVIARAGGVDRALVTCDEDNIGSAAVIEHCGGHYESTVEGPPGEPPIRRYWIA
jgi:predicted acetyltransferase